jgi:hypothetical protein
MRAAVVFQCLTATTRSVAALGYVIRESLASFPLAGDIVNEFKIGFDWATYLFSLVNLSCVLAVVPNRNSPRVVLDSMIVTTQVMGSIRDTYVAAYRRKSGDNPPAFEGLCYAESVFGVLILIGVCVSIGLEANEDPPLNVPVDEWKTIFSLKFIQNAMTGLFQTTGFVPTLPDGTPRKIGVVTRGVLLGIRGLTNIARAGVETAVAYADMP